MVSACLHVRVFLTLADAEEGKDEIVDSDENLQNASECLSELVEEDAYEKEDIDQLATEESPAADEEPVPATDLLTNRRASLHRETEASIYSVHQKMFQRPDDLMFTTSGIVYFDKHN